VEKRAAKVNQTTSSQSDGERYVNWVSEFLPNDLPTTACKDTRIFFYNYESFWKRDAVKTRLWDLANDLLEHIKTIRRSEGVSTMAWSVARS
jgi:hypothetical protein